jgi:hypothetical protein
MGFFDDWFEDTFIPFIASTATGGIADLGYAIEKGGNVFDVVDRAIDPGGILDKGTRSLGEKLPQWARNAAPGVGGLIGNIWGPGGAAAGAGVGSKLAGSDTKSGMQQAGMAAISSWLGGKSFGGSGNETNGLQAATTEINPPLGYEQTLGQYVPGGGMLNYDASLSPDLAGYDLSTSGINPPMGYQGELGKYVTGAGYNIPYGKGLKVAGEMLKSATQPTMPKFTPFTPVINDADYAIKARNLETTPDYAKPKKEETDEEKKERERIAKLFGMSSIEPSAPLGKEYLDYTTLPERLKEILRMNPGLYA